MHAAAHGRVREDHVAGLETVASVVAVADGVPVLDLPFHRVRHRSDHGGHVRRVGHEAAVGREHGAREIEAFLDVGAHAGLLQGAAHLLGDRHEAVREDGELDRIDLRGEVGVGFGRGEVHHDEVVEDGGGAGGRDEDRLRAVDDQGWAVDLATGGQGVEEEDGRACPSEAFEVGLGVLGRFWCPVRRFRDCRSEALRGETGWDVKCTSTD